MHYDEVRTQRSRVFFLLVLVFSLRNLPRICLPHSSQCQRVIPRVNLIQMATSTAKQHQQKLGLLIACMWPKSQFYHKNRTFELPSALGPTSSPGSLFFALDHGDEVALGTIFVASLSRDKLTTGLQHDLRLSQCFKTCFKMLRHFGSRCRMRQKLYRVNRSLDDSYFIDEALNLIRAILF